MAEELGKLEKPEADNFKKGRKLYFIPVFYGGRDAPADYIEKLKNYWEQVEQQVSSLELKLGKISKIFHEFIPDSGENGLKVIKELNVNSYEVVKNRVNKGAQFEALEDHDLLTEFMDWGSCLAIGLQNQNVVAKVYEFYAEVAKKRNEYIIKHIDESIKGDEVGMLLMREGHQLQFPADIEVFYISPPALDEISRWYRDQEAKSQA
jgi:hypothetical protein